MHLDWPFQTRIKTLSCTSGPHEKRCCSPCFKCKVLSLLLTQFECIYSLSLQQFSVWCPPLCAITLTGWSMSIAYCVLMDANFFSFFRTLVQVYMTACYRISCLLSVNSRRAGSQTVINIMWVSGHQSTPGWQTQTSVPEYRLFAVKHTHTYTQIHMHNCRIRIKGKATGWLDTWFSVSLILFLLSLNLTEWYCTVSGKISAAAVVSKAPAFTEKCKSHLNAVI